MTENLVKSLIIMEDQLHLLLFFLAGNGGSITWYQYLYFLKFFYCQTNKQKQDLIRREAGICKILVTNTLETSNKKG